MNEDAFFNNEKNSVIRWMDGKMVWLKSNITDNYKHGLQLAMDSNYNLLK